MATNGRCVVDEYVALYIVGLIYFICASVSAGIVLDVALHFVGRFV